MKTIAALVIAGALLAGCGGGGNDVECREVRYIHLDNTWEYMNVCDDVRTMDRYSRDGVTEQELFPR